MSRQANIPLEGEFNCWTRDFDLPDLIFRVCQTGQTGLLRFVNVEAEKTLLVRDGRVIFATSSSSDDRLGEYLLRMGKVRLKVLTEIGREVRPGKRLGALLVERGVLEPKQLVDAVVGHVRSMIVSLFRWTDGWYGFTTQELPSKETITLEIPTADLILAGVRQIDSWRRILKGVGELGTCYRAVPGRESVARSMDVDARGVELLSALSEPLTVEAVCARSELHDFEVCRLLWVYRSVGFIERVDPELLATERVAPSASETVAAPKPTEVREQTPVAVGMMGVELASSPPEEPVPHRVEAKPVVKPEAHPHPFEVWRESCSEPVGGEPAPAAIPGNGGLVPGADPPTGASARVEPAEMEREKAAEPPIESGDADLEGLGMVLQNDPLKTLRSSSRAPAPDKISKISKISRDV